MAVTASFRALMAASITGTSVFGNSPNWAAQMEESISLVDGTAADQCDRLYWAERTVNSASNDDLDLSGVLTNPLGTAITQVELVAILLINKPRAGTPLNTTNLTIGAGSNPCIAFLGATHMLGPIRPGGVFLLGCPDAAGIGAVTAGTGDILRIANSSGAANTYQIALLGRSA